MQKPDLSKLTKNNAKDDKKLADDHENEALFEMDGLNEGSDWADSIPKTFAATQLGAAESEANQTVQKISEHNDFRPIDAAPNPSMEEVKPNGNGKKKKKTRKISSKKKHQRKSSTSSISSQSDLISSEQRAPAAISNTDINFFSDTEVTAVNHR